MARRTNTANAKRVVGYVRCSTDDQHLGPEAQREALARWCAANGAELVAVHDDLGVSGGAALDKRLGLLAAIDALQAHGAGVLLVAKRDRLARDVMVAAMVERLAERAGARVLAADGTGNGEGPEALLMRSIVDAFAQYERALIRARTRAALAVKKSKGERTGEVPYGYRLAADGRSIESDETEQRALRLIDHLRGDGLSLRAVVAKLNELGEPARGGRWHLTTVARIVRQQEAA